MRTFDWLNRIIKSFIGCHTKDLVWYACYGSNLYRKRFLYYIQGGGQEGATEQYKGCSNKNAPQDDRKVRIPHQLYFSKRSSRWENRGVTFIKSEKDETDKTLGRMYLITKDQFLDIVRQESGRNSGDESITINFEKSISEGSSIVPGITWYGRIIYLGFKRSYPIFTCTATWSDAEINLNPPGEKYLRLIIKGLKETYGYKNERIIEYLKALDGIKGHLEDEEIATLVTSSNIE